tara:strand:+ start:16549 stop:16827 length:279 start_codon:yes stop_codon:yes gene_type:complete
MNKIVSVIIGLLIISILVVLGVLASKNILHIEDKAGTWEFWSLYGLTIIMFISQFVLYKSYIDLRNSKGVSGKNGERGDKGLKGFKGKCIWR